MSSRTTEKKKSSPNKINETNNSPPLTVKGESKVQDQAKCNTNNLQRFSCEVPRSPTLPAKIRRSNSVNSPENFHAPPALMARLMGLEELPTATSKALPPRSPLLVPSEYSTAEKRRRLIGALEKCDRDLKALKKIIDAVRSAERLPLLPTTVFGSPESNSTGGDHQARVGKMFLNHINAEQPSPVSVLDVFMARSPLSGYQCSKRQSYNYGTSLILSLHDKQVLYLNSSIIIGSTSFLTNPIMQLISTNYLVSLLFFFFL